MSNIQVHIDRCDSKEIAGWADENGPVSSLHIELNGKWIANLAPTSFRSDLKQAGLGDGRRAFSFSLAGYLESGENVIVVKFNHEVVYEGRIGANPADHSNAAQISRRRWQGQEVAYGITWGRMMTGDTLWDIYQTARTFRSSDRILEIGPGYGRLLKTAVQRKILFASYVGIDLSAARVKELTREFGSERVRFYEGDIDTWHRDTKFDVVICSATFEHLYPDCEKALRNIRNQMSIGANVFIDFIRTDTNRAGFEEDGTYVREYLRDELLGLFEKCRFSNVTIETCKLGDGVAGPVERFVVKANIT